MKIVPSLASANQLELGKAIDCLGKRTPLHLDVEDGHFVPNITFGLRTIREVLSYPGTPKETDVHLLVSNPSDYVEELLAIGVRSIAFHIEAEAYPAQLLHRIRKAGARAGIALNCRTDASALLYYTDETDYVIQMTAEPDGKNQQFNEAVLAKLSGMRKMLPARISIMADGDISLARLPQLAEAGVDTAVMGREIFGAADCAKRFDEILEGVANV